MKHNCLSCGKEFEVHSLIRKYCSLPCARQGRRKGCCKDCQTPIRSNRVRCLDCRNKIRDAWLENEKILRRKKSYEIGREPRGRFQHLKKSLRSEEIPLADLIWNKNFYIALIKDAVCHYCLGPLSPTGHALDRKDNSIGHTACNVVPCCRLCNGIKNKYWEYEHMMLLAPKLRKLRVSPIAPDGRVSLS